MSRLADIGRYIYMYLFTAGVGGRREDAGWMVYTYWSPTHERLPFPNGWRYFSSLLRSCGSSQRPGWKAVGLGKMVGLKWVNLWVMETGVWIVREISKISSWIYSPWIRQVGS